MNLSPTQKNICERVLNAFETGSADGDYSNISIYRDGPHGIRQVTYGRSQTTEYGKLQDLLRRYVAANGKFSQDLAGYVPKIGHIALVDDSNFKNLLRRAGGEDPVMRAVQDLFFEERYWAPALQWAETNGFTQPLSMLTIYDSFIHSGSILGFLRSRFPESPPVAGGNEKTWISQYVAARQFWLGNHSNEILRQTVYRTKCLRRELDRNNWDLAQLPINANGTLIRPLPGLAAPAPLPGGGGGQTEPIPFHGDFNAGKGEGPEIPGVDPGGAPIILTPGFAAKAAELAVQQWEFFGKQTSAADGNLIHSGRKEGEDGWWQRVGVYWEKIGRDDLDGRDHEWPWSAAFISWLMREAGAGSRFSYSSLHATYISKAIRDRNQGNTNASYWAYRLAERTPQVGDLVCWDRDPNKTVDFDHQHNGSYSSHTDLVVSVGPNEVEIIGGNVGNSVTRKPLRLDADGRLVPATVKNEKLFALMACRL